MVHMRRILATAAVLTALLLAFAAPGAALAHEGRTVAGKYEFTVGFITEPAFAGQMNAIDLRVAHSAEKEEDETPVEGVEQTLKAEVIVGGGAQVMPVELRTRFNQPGAYAGYFMPTRAGSYTFHFTGTIEGTPIDERFESGPGRFNDVQDPQPLQFPDKLPSAGTVADDLQAAHSEAAAARNLALVGLGAGVLGVIVGGLSLLARRREAPVTAPTMGERGV
jgi:hypothetical protein